MSALPDLGLVFRDLPLHLLNLQLVHVGLVDAEGEESDGDEEGRTRQRPPDDDGQGEGGARLERLPPPISESRCEFDGLFLTRSLGSFLRE